MKNIQSLIRSILLLMLPLITSECYSQIKVATNGSIGIKTIYPDPNYDVHIKGRNIWFDQTWPGVFSEPHFNGQQDVSCLRPGNDYSVFLGTSKFRWEQVHAKHIHSLDIHLTTNPIVGSDIKIKKNIREISDPVEKISKLHGIMFDFKDESLPKDNYGFIAQEVKDVLPEIVSYSKELDIYGVKYEEVIPLLVECSKRQQKQIDSLILLLNTLINPNKELGNKLNESKLFQNYPNPFKNSSDIYFDLKDFKDSAVIKFYDVSGNEIYSINISNYKGFNKINIDGFKHKPGMYYYSLIIDDSKVNSFPFIVVN